MKNKTTIIMKILILIGFVISSGNCSGPDNDIIKPIPEPPVATNEMDFWLTKSNQSAKLQKQSGILAFGNTVNNYVSREIDGSKTFQSIAGF